MVDKRFVASLSELSGPLLTAYLNAQPSDPSQQPLAAEAVVWMQKQAKALAGSIPEKERKAFEKQVARIIEFFQDRKPEEKALAIFAGAGTWKTVPVQLRVENELHWGRPAATQLLWLLSEHKPHCVVVVDRKGARFFRHWCGEMEQLAIRKFAVDIPEWKKKDQGHVTAEGIKKTRGSQRDTYEQRMAAQYKRMCRETAVYANRLSETKKLLEVFIIGPERLAGAIEQEFPKRFRERVRVIKEDFGGLSQAELQQRLAPRIAEWEIEREAAMVKNLLAEERKAVVGLDETLTQLQKGKMRTVVLANTVHGELHECIECGWMDRSADPVCPVCGRERRSVELRETLPDLARSKNTGIEVVSGRAAEELIHSGGMGGWLRGRTQAQLR